MLQNHAQSLLRNAVISAKNGEYKLAEQYLDRVFAATDDHDTLAEAWYRLSEITSDPAEKRKMVENALSHNMTHAQARRSLAILDGKIKSEEVVDPDALPAAPQEDVKADAQRFTCPKCGGRMVYSPDGRSLVCEFCARDENLSSTGGKGADEQDFFAAMATVRGHSKPVARQVFHCQGCGAEFILPPGVISATCAYCASPHVVSLAETRALLDPDAIIPHVFDQRRAIRILVDWVRQHEFTPQGKVIPPRGFYLPVWTFDVGGSIDYRGESEPDEIDVVLLQQPSPGREQGSYPVLVDDLSIPASSKLERRVEPLIATYDLRQAKPYDPRYLSDWPAEVYDVPLADASLAARSQAYARYKKILPQKFAHLENFKMSSANLAIDSYKLLLLPLWMTVVPYEDKEYVVLVNGQTGTVQGEVPPGAQKSIKGWLSNLLDA